MKNITIFILLLLGTLHVWAQPQMRFTVETNNLGTVLWSNPVISDFVFTNTGNEPLEIKDVKPACACTIADWTKSPVQPGQTGKITAVFDAKALGTFFKEVEVYSNVSDDPVYLAMEGKVVATDDELVPTEDYDIVLGDVHINRDAIVFDKVNKGTEPVEEILIMNPSRAAFEPVLMHLPEYLEATAMPRRIPAGRSGRIRVKLVTSKLHDVGLTQVPIYLSRFMGDKVGEDNKIDVSVVMLPDFSNLTPQQLADAPKLQLSQTEVAIPKNKAKVKAVILVTNAGKQPLEVDRLQTFSSAVSVNIPQKTLPAGQSMKMSIAVDKSKLKKNRQLRILMITNDPENAGQVITIKTE